MVGEDNTPPASHGAGTTSTTANAIVAVFTPITQPVLRSVDPVLVANLLKERERYELKVKGKQSEVPTLAIGTWASSIDRSLLKNLVYMGKFATIAPAIADPLLLQESHIEKYVKSLVSRNSNSTFEPAVIESALQSLKFPSHIADADARITLYCNELFE